MVSRVVVRNASYDYDSLRQVMYDVFNVLMCCGIDRGKTVIIKPNLLAAAGPEKAIVTHPLLIRAVAEYVLEKGARPVLSDSPASISGSFDAILRKSGITEALDGLDVEFREFKRSVHVDVGKPFEKVLVAEDAVAADVLINLPKLKTHSQMTLTLGVKNLFGCIVGMKKPEWHIRAGVDRDMFARLLVKICAAVRPSITIMDGILAMEGQGPGSSGKPRPLGVVIAGTDAFAVDISVCRMLGMDPGLLPTNRVAMEDGLVTGDVEIDGELPSVPDFLLPDVTPAVFGPKMLHAFLRKHLIQRPECDHLRCKLCGECWDYCPVKAISRSREKIEFNYDACIRCYCCIEVCPHGALLSREPLPGKLTRRLFRT